MFSCIARLLFILFLLSACSEAYSNVSRSPERRAADALADSVRLYHKFVGTDPVVGWDQIAKAVPNLASFQSLLPGNDITLLYSFVPLADRSKFEKGILIAVTYKPLPWPDINKEVDPDNSSEFLQSASHRPLRYLIYQALGGEFLAEQWYDDEFVKMIAERGIAIPAPVHYSPPVILPYGAGPASGAAAQNPTHSKEESIEVRGAVATLPDISQSQKSPESTNSFFWILGIAAVLAVAVVTVIGRKKRS